MNPTSWSKFVQENFDKLLLVFVFLACIVLVVHLVHDARDQELVLWGREIADTVLGALLGLITGHALAASRTTATTTGNPPATSVVTETK
jgi:hypothetical protein